MTKKARKLSVYISLVVIPFGAATVRLAGKASHTKQVNTVDASQETDAAFRDGLYMGRLDAEDARNVRPSVSRWSEPKDRASFLAGYQRGYEEGRATKIAEDRK
jgi:basic membrane lipoprotein Med (substrate-binding protein (PBP1-ABC) superfamily)